jgi:hypothetical protein
LYLLTMASKSAKDAADAKAIADNFAATAAKAIEDARGTVYDGCGAGAMMCNGVCVGFGAPTAENPYPYKCPDTNGPVTDPYPFFNPQPTPGGGINPALILAAAAAAFFIGG